MSKALLRSLEACPEAEDWYTTQNSPQEAWQNCERGDWMLWLAGKLEIDHKVLVFAACQCARLSLKYVPEGELRPLKAIETTEAWCRGEATLEEVKADADAAYAANAAADAAAYAAYAAYAASASNAANAANADADARTATRKDCADLVRKHIPWELIEEKI